jgi:hypothetical protein
MGTNQFSADQLSSLRKHLLGGEPFMKLATAFVDALAARDDHTNGRDGSAECMKAYYQAFTQESAWEVEKLAESPIEKTFLHSLILSFIKSGTLVC